MNRGPVGRERSGDCPERFTTTDWSVVQAAGGAASPEARAALEDLCHRYWHPLYACVRRRGQSEHDAQDLVQGSFARLLEKESLRQADPNRGRFRTFMRCALEDYLADEWDRARRLTRGGGQTPISIDALTAEQRYQLEPADPSDPARLFERRWATTLLERTLEALEREYTGNHRGEVFLELRRFLLGEHRKTSYADTAKRLGISVAAARMAASRMRRRYWELLRSQILQTVSSASEADEEYRSLMAALRD